MVRGVHHCVSGCNSIELPQPGVLYCFYSLMTPIMPGVLWAAHFNAFSPGKLKDDIIVQQGSVHLFLRMRTMPGYLWAAHFDARCPGHLKDARIGQPGSLHCLLRMSVMPGCLWTAQLIGGRPGKLKLAWFTHPCVLHKWGTAFITTGSLGMAHWNVMSGPAKLQLYGLTQSQTM